MGADSVHRLTDFQRETERLLRAHLERVGVVLEDYEVSGVREVFIRGRLSGTDLRVFIYEDGAEVSSPPGEKEHKVDDRFERPDFRSLAELSAAFVESAVRRATEAGA
jgi:hypothetical protein